jgi:hypothetical protein
MTRFSRSKILIPENPLCDRGNRGPPGQRTSHPSRRVGQAEIGACAAGSVRDERPAGDSPRPGERRRCRPPHDRVPRSREPASSRSSRLAEQDLATFSAGVVESLRSFPADR